MVGGGRCRFILHKEEFKHSHSAGAHRPADDAPLEEWCDLRCYTEVACYAEIDSVKDGHCDILALDTTGDGEIDLIASDAEHGGKFDRLASDEMGDGNFVIEDIVEDEHLKSLREHALGTVWVLEELTCLDKNKKGVEEFDWPEAGKEGGFTFARLVQVLHGGECKESKLHWLAEIMFIVASVL